MKKLSISLILCLFTLSNVFAQSIESELSFNTFASEAKPKVIYRFKLTELLGKSLIKPATFTVDPSSTKWVLNMNNGKSITYTILSGNDDDPLCGLRAKDSLGDRCEICIKNTGGTSTTVTFNYSGDKYVYTGHYIK